MRSTLYWLTCSIIAVLCVKAAATPHIDLEMVAASMTQPLPGAGADPIRAILLGVGIMSVAYTFQRIWLNFRTEEK